MRQRSLIFAFGGSASRTLFALPTILTIDYAAVVLLEGFICEASVGDTNAGDRDTYLARGLAVQGVWCWRWPYSQL